MDVATYKLSRHRETARCCPYRRPSRNVHCVEFSCANHLFSATNRVTCYPVLSKLIKNNFTAVEAGRVTLSKDYIQLNAVLNHATFSLVVYRVPPCVWTVVSNYPRIYWRLSCVICTCEMQNSFTQLHSDMTSDFCFFRCAFSGYIWWTKLTTRELCGLLAHVSWYIVHLNLRLYGFSADSQKTISWLHLNIASDEQYSASFCHVFLWMINCSSHRAGLNVMIYELLKLN